MLLKEQQEDYKFKTGFEIRSPKAHYTVVRVIGQGGFEEVYQVKSNDGNKYAMKMERKSEKRKIVRLNIELAVLKDVGNSKHFTKIMDRGKSETDGFHFTIMELVGKSLRDLKSERSEKVFSSGTRLRVASQCLEAVEEVHKQGYIHRDLKPGNFACGLANRHNLVYILDFGLARRYVNAMGHLKTPRHDICFTGTVLFASMSCHRGVEMSPKDDVESWFYLLIDLILPGGPWRKSMNTHEVIEWKEECRKEKRHALQGLKYTTELEQTLAYIDSKQYQERIDYDLIQSLLAKAYKSAGLSINAAYDWEESEKKTSK